MPVKGFQQISVTSAVAVALTVPAGTSKAVVTCYTAPVRYRSDGSAPTTTVGTVLSNGSTLEIKDIAGLNQIQFIALATTAELNVHYYG